MDQSTSFSFMFYWSIFTISEEGPAWLAAVERGKGLLLLAHKGIPPHLVWPSELPDFLQAALQVVDGVIGPVVHQTCQQALGIKDKDGGVAEVGGIRRDSGIATSLLWLMFSDCGSSEQPDLVSADPASLSWLQKNNNFVRSSLNSGWRMNTAARWPVYCQRGDDRRRIWEQHKSSLCSGDICPPDPEGFKTKPTLLFISTLLTNISHRHPRQKTKAFPHWKRFDVLIQLIPFEYTHPQLWAVNVRCIYDNDEPLDCSMQFKLPVNKQAVIACIH